MKKILLFILTLYSISSFGQSTIPLRADTVEIIKNGGNANLNIYNATRNLNGAYLRNRSGGRTDFHYVLDSVWVDGDSIKFRYGPTTMAVIAGSGGGPTYNAGYGLLLSSNTFKVDTTLISTRLWRQKGIDSINTYISANYYTRTQINAFFGGTSVIGGYNKTNWDAAFGWGNHASLYPTISRFNDSLANHWTAIMSLAAGPFADMTKAVYDTDNDGLVEGSLLQPTITYGALTTYLSFPRDGMSTWLMDLIGGQPTSTSNIPYWNGTNMVWNGGLAIRASNRITTGNGADTLARLSDVRSLVSVGSTPIAATRIPFSNGSTYSSNGQFYFDSTNITLRVPYTRVYGASIIEGIGFSTDSSLWQIQSGGITTGSKLLFSSYSDAMIPMKTNFQLHRNGRTEFVDGLAFYSQNRGSQFTARSLVDKGYVDSVAALGGSGVTDGDKTDVAISGSGAIYTVEGLQSKTLPSLPVSTRFLKYTGSAFAYDTIAVAELPPQYLNEEDFPVGDGTLASPIQTFRETTQEFTGSTSLTLTVSNTMVRTGSVLVFYNGLPMDNAAFSASGTTVTLSGLTRETSDKIKVKYSY